jgi:hypothetical protein
MEAIARAKKIFLETKTTRFDSDPAVDAITLGAPSRSDRRLPNGFLQV